MNIYTRAGAANRTEYLKHLSEAYEVPLSDLTALAELLGPDEDFDWLITAAQDLSDLIEGSQ